ncbi:hypothetical protein JCM5353_001439 [Sporobolomyces roseus]
MGNADLQAYLASKYMTGAKADAICERQSSSSSSDPTSTKKRKKRKVESVASKSGTSAGNGFVVADQDEDSWSKINDEETEEYKPVVEERRGHFKSKSNNSTWSTIRDSDPSLVQPLVEEEEEEVEPEDEAPVVVSTSKGGLQSASELRAEQERQKLEQERKRLKAERELARRKARGEIEDEEQEGEGQNTTVYRDSSGRKIDMKLQKAEEAKRKRQEMEQEMAKMEWGKGLVQREDKERQKREAEKLKMKGVARYADDAEMNDELREVERWNDPAANFLTKAEKKSTKSKSKFPPYTGPPPPPNRFNIKPGYRWDGVDRGTGWEAKYMQKKNSSAMFKAAAHAFSTEDM